MTSRFLYPRSRAISSIEFSQLPVCGIFLKIPTFIHTDQGNGNVSHTSKVPPHPLIVLEQLDDHYRVARSGSPGDRHRYRHACLCSTMVEGSCCLRLSTSYIAVLGRREQVQFGANSAQLNCVIFRHSLANRFHNDRVGYLRLQLKMQSGKCSSWLRQLNLSLTKLLSNISLASP
jgi:hypothetical protein